MATWTSLYLAPSVESNPSFVRLVILVPRFVRESVIAGADVARRALDPRLPLQPGFVIYPTRLPQGVTRNTFCSLMSLLPGTLPTGSDKDGAIVVHCLDVTQPVAKQMAEEERLFVRALGGESNYG